MPQYRLRAMLEELGPYNEPVFSARAEGFLSDVEYGLPLRTLSHRCLEPMFALLQEHLQRQHEARITIVES